MPWRDHGDVAGMSSLDWPEGDGYQNIQASSKIARKWEQKRNESYQAPSHIPQLFTIAWWATVAEQYGAKPNRLKLK